MTALTGIKRFIWPLSEKKCIYCRVKLKYRDATVDHFKPVSKGGDPGPVNCLIACDSCNNRKGDMVFDSIEQAIKFLKGET